MERPAADNGYQAGHAEILASSFRYWTGRDLAAPGPDLARRLYQAPFALVSHASGPDPCFDYANESAQQLFEMGWEAFIRTPSRQSAAPADQDQRAELMARVARDGYLEGYSSTRVSARGRRFRILEAVIWNLLDREGTLCGQAACLPRWNFLE
ncbi:MAG TPA: MEKHLA domain-containing protein [Sedimenticola sp.]|nr:MEKHLA domain-containing protein [Sedimenticola sp.]